MPIILPELPFDKGALSPHISEKTIEFHYGKHHKTYVEKLNFITESITKLMWKRQMLLFRTQTW
jgi:superoxide dismutase